MLQVQELVAGYGKVQVLHGLSLSVPEGQLVTLIGSNGAGKTTTLARHLGHADAQQRDHQTGWPGYRRPAVPQGDAPGLAHSPEGRRVFPTLSVRDNLQLGAFTRLIGVRPEGRCRGRYRTHVRDLSTPQGTPGAIGRHAVGRRAADAGHGRAR